MFPRAPLFITPWMVIRGIFKTIRGVFMAIRDLFKTIRSVFKTFRGVFKRNRLKCLFDVFTVNTSRNSVHLLQLAVR